MYVIITAVLFFLTKNQIHFQNTLKKMSNFKRCFYFYTLLPTYIFVYVKTAHRAEYKFNLVIFVYLKLIQFFVYFSQAFSTRKR